MQQIVFQKQHCYWIINSKTGLALESAHQTREKTISLEFGPPNHNNNRQLWIFQKKEGGANQIISAVNDHALTVSSKDVKLKPAEDEEDTQYWVIDQMVFGKLKICPAKHRNKYLTFDNQKAVLMGNIAFDDIDCWQFKKITENLSLKHSCVIQCPKTGKLIDVPGGTQKQGSHLVIWDPHYRFNQRWNLYKAGEVFVIKNVLTKLNIDIQGENYEDGTKLLQWKPNGNTNQFWKLEPVEGKKGEYRIEAFYDPEFELGHDGKRLKLKKGRQFTWKIIGHIPSDRMQ